MSQNVDINTIETYNCGHEGLIVGMCENIGLTKLIDEALTARTGRRPDIPYSTVMELMLVNMCDNHHPLYAYKDYYQGKDLEGIFHKPIDLEKITDDRLALFLDAFYDAEPHKLYSMISLRLMRLYGIRIRTMNFDTTSKVMWGLYENTDGTQGVIEIEFGHSKDKRADKKQIKFGMGCANGLPVDAEVLSGNKDDKSYNTDVLDRIDQMINFYDVDRNAFYYIADSALFSEKNLKIAKKKGIHLITRMTDNVTLAKKLTEKAMASFDHLTPMEITKKSGASTRYLMLEDQGTYKRYPLKMVCYYSENLRAQKEKTIKKKVKKECGVIEELNKDLEKRLFACEKDAQLEAAKIMNKDLKKISYHEISYEVVERITRRRGRPSKDPEKNIGKINYQVVLIYTQSEEAIEEDLRKSCMFVLCSNDTNISGIDLIKEYKTQDEVEKRFTALKSTEFVNSIFLNTPKRIVAFAYLMLICILLLSAAEYVVKRELFLQDAHLIGSGNRKVKRPNIKTLMRMIQFVRVRVIKHKDKPWERSFVDPPNDNIQKILDYLYIPLENFICGSK